MIYSLIALATLISGTHLNLPPDEVSRRVEAECVDGKWSSDCPALLSDVEVDLYGNLHALAAERQPIDRDVLVVAASGKFPMLAELGLRQLGQITNDAEREAVLAAFEHPSPAVRQAARGLLDAADEQRAKTYGRWWRAGNRGGWDSMVPDTLPTQEQLGLRDVSDLRYRYFASDEHRAVFTSQLLPTELMGRIAPGIKPQTGDQAARKAQKRKEASERTDTATNALEEGLARGGLGAFAGLAKRASKQVENPDDAQQKKDLEPLEEFGANQAAVLYIQIDRPRAAAPAQVAAGRDEGLGETVLVVRY
jgi:hypothetical protein